MQHTILTTQYVVGLHKLKLVGLLGFNGILSMQIASISCLRNFKVY